MSYDSMSTDVSDPEVSDTSSILSDKSEVQGSLGTLADLPMDIIYCIFETMEPSAAISLALTNKTNMWLFSQWLDTAKSLQDFWGGPGLTEMFQYLREQLRQRASGDQRRETAQVLRRWQCSILHGREVTEKWNVCNGCLKFKQDDCVRCTATCDRFICAVECVL